MLKVFLMMAAMTALLVVLGTAVGGRGMAMFFLVLALVMNLAMYWWSDKAVLKMYRAKVIGPEDAPQVYEMVDRLRQRAGLPMPVVAIAPSEQPNAFATGRNYKKAVVCVTSGLMQLVNKEEMEGIIAHELAHIKNRDMLTMTLAATMAGAIAMIGNVVKWGAIFGLNRRGGGHPIVLIAMAILAPIAAMIIQMAISRQNEFKADRTGAEIAGSPTGLANALRRLDSASRRIPMDVNPAAAQLCIVNPLSAMRGGGMTKLFSTHPRTEDRIARLEALDIRSFR